MAYQVYHTYFLPHYNIRIVSKVEDAALNQEPVESCGSREGFSYDTYKTLEDALRRCLPKHTSFTDFSKEEKQKVAAYFNKKYGLSLTARDIRDNLNKSYEAIDEKARKADRQKENALNAG